MKLLNISITEFRNYKTVVREHTLTSIYHIISGSANSDITARLRHFIATGNEEIAENTKRSMMAVTFSASYEGGRVDANFKKYNYLVCLDFDNVGADNIPAALKISGDNRHTALHFISPGAEGFKIIVPTKPASGRLDESNLESVKQYHNEAFRQVADYYEKLTGHPVDRSGKDISRLCFLPADPHAYFNREAEAFVVENEMEIGKDGPGNRPKKEKKSKTKVGQNVKIGENMEGALFRVMCKRLEEGGEFYVGGNRNNFLYLLAGKLNEYGVSHQTAYEIARKEFTELTQNEILGTIKSGYGDKGKHGSKKVSHVLYNRLKIQNYLDKHFTSVYDVINNETLIAERGKESEGFQSVDDYFLNSIVGDMIELGIDCTSYELSNLIHSSFCKKFNPILNYLENCPEWDGKDRITELADTVITTNRNFWRDVFKRFLVGSIMGCLDADKMNQIVPLLTGAQGIGKTTFLFRLAPPELKKYTSYGIPRPSDKDDAIRITNSLFIILDEFENIRDRELSYLKDIITRPYFNIRLPYGHRAESLKHIASFAGTSNYSEILHDQTGNRRFHCFDVSNIDLNYQIDYRQFYAQIYGLYKAGEKCWFDTEDNLMIAFNNKKFEHQTSEFEWISTYVRHPRENEKATYTSVTEIANWIRGLNQGILVNANLKIKFGQALIKQDYRAIHTHDGRKYVVKLLNYAQVKFIQNFRPPVEYDKEFDYYYHEIFILAGADATYEQIVNLYLSKYPELRQK